MTDALVEKVARAIYEVMPHYDLDQGFEVMSWDDLVAFEEGAGYTPTITVLRDKARAAIAAMPPALSPELIDKLNKLATYLTEQGEYEACDLIDTVVERLTPKAKG